MAKRRKVFETIAFVGDLHCGSYEGLWPEEEINGKSARYIATRYVNQCFDHFVKTIPDLDLLIFMGDIIDGRQRKSDSTGIYTSDLSEQTDGAIEVVRPLVKKAKKVIRIWGTPYHEGFHGALKAFDKEFDVGLVDQVLNLELTPGNILNVAHHPTGGAGIYKGTALDKEAVWSSVAEQEKKVPGARWIVRGHRHFWGMQETSNKVVIINPCFQLPNGWAKKANLWRFQPDLGAVLMRSEKTHPFGYRFTPYLYDVPMPKVYKPEDIK
jgi:hypothetical protein